MERACFLSSRPAGVGRGAQVIEVLPAPVAGADWSWTVPAGYWWRVLAATATLTSSAAVGNRRVAAQISDQDANILARIPAINELAPSKFALYSLVWGVGVGATVASGDTAIELPDVLLPAGYRFGANTFNLDATDKWSNVRLWAEQYEDRGAERYAATEHIHAVIEILQGAVHNA